MSDRQVPSHLYFKVYNKMISSSAWKEIAGHPSAVTMLINAYARQSVPPSLKRRRQLEKAGLWPPKEAAPFSLPVKDSEGLGMSVWAWRRGIEKLHTVGFLTRTKAGSAVKGDYAEYVLSERWRRWVPPDGGPNFEHVPWLRPDMFWLEEVRDAEGKPLRKVRDAHGKFIPRRGRKTVAKKMVVVPDTTTKAPLMVSHTTTAPPVVVPHTTNECPKGALVVVPHTMSLSNPYFSMNPEEGRKKKKGLALGEVGQDSGHGGDGIPEIFTEALSHLPDDKKQFVFDLWRKVEEGNLPPRFARTKLVMPRIVTAEVALKLFPDPPKGGRP